MDKITSREEFLDRLRPVRDQLKSIVEASDHCGGDGDDANAMFWAHYEATDALHELNTAVEELDGTVNDAYFESELKKPLLVEAAESEP